MLNKKLHDNVILELYQPADQDYIGTVTIKWPIVFKLIKSYFKSLFNKKKVVLQAFFNGNNNYTIIFKYV